MLSAVNSQTGMRVLAVMMASALAGCGGGGGGGGSSTPPDNGAGAVIAQQCSASNPFRADALAPTTVGSLADEKRWAASYMNQAYLWYREIPNVNANAGAYSNENNVFGSLQAYFDALRTPAKTTSGKDKDEFSFIYSTKAWRELSQSGTSLGYGIEWHLSSSTPPRGIKVAFVEPNTPAANAGIQRGDVLVSVDGVSADDSSTSGVATLNGALYPSNSGGHSFVFNRNGSEFTDFLAPATVTRQPVLTRQTLDVDGRKVGYMVFNDHIASAEQPLIDAVEAFAADNIEELVLDLRYNGGGYLFLASELSYMIAGATQTQSKVFERLQYNDKRTADTANAVTPFYNTRCLLDSNFNCTSQAALPVLNLSRLYVLTSGSTCSASEAIINGLRGIDVEVVLLGNTTCGKPYGFTAKDNCGISYFPIEFQGVNQKGFGDYADGFVATCTVADDFRHALGDAEEGMLAAAIQHIRTGSCPSSNINKTQAPEGRLLRSPIRENRFLVPRS